MPNHDHYFSPRPSAPERRRQFRVRLRGEEFVFVTDAGVFSRDRVDAGTKLLIERIELPLEGVFLDLGAGYGPIGIALARLRPNAQVVMVEINERAAELAAENARWNGVRNAEVVPGDALEALGERRFDVVATNPPIRAGNAVVEALIAEAAGRLEPRGSFWLVARTRQGAGSMKLMVEARFGHARLRARGAGYRLFEATRGEP